MKLWLCVKRAPIAIRFESYKLEALLLLDDQLVIWDGGYNWWRAWNSWHLIHNLLAETWASTSWDPVHNILAMARAWNSWDHIHNLLEMMMVTGLVSAWTTVWDFWRQICALFSWREENWLHGLWFIWEPCLVPFKWSIYLVATFIPFLPGRDTKVGYEMGHGYGTHSHKIYGKYTYIYYIYIFVCICLCINFLIYKLFKKLMFASYKF